MKYFICPFCLCVNAHDVEKCGGCGVSSFVIFMLPPFQLVEFGSIEELDKWIVTMRQKMGSKVWRRGVPKRL